MLQNLFHFTSTNPIAGRKDKVELLGAKRAISVEGTKAEEEQETCFSCSLAPSELYMEFIHSYSATCIVDVSPGQGEFLKAALSTRTKAVAICGTESHCARLELLLTEYLLGELSREGSTFYRPESVSKDDTVEVPNKAEPKKKSKKVTENAEPEPVKKKARKAKGAGEEGAGEDKPKAEEPKKKAKKTTKKEEEQEADEGDEESSELWAWGSKFRFAGASVSM